jgi:hypothetical protein
MVERENLRRAQHQRHVAARQALGQAFGDCRLPDAGGPNERRVVLALAQGISINRAISSSRTDWLQLPRRASR